MGYIAGFILAVVLLFIFFKIIVWPLKLLWKIIINGLLGIFLLFITNFIGNFVGITIGINIWTALIAGFFGIPGVIFLLILKFLL